MKAYRNADAVHAQMFQKPVQKGSEQAKSIANAIRARQCQKASDGIKKVKAGREAPVRTRILQESSTAHLKDLLKSKGRFLSDDHRKAIEIELKMRETGVPF